jgi:iron complex outermembrane recepter protein
MKTKFIAILCSFTCLTTPAFAQDSGDVASTGSTAKDDLIVVTGSSIKRKPTESAVPLQIFTTEDIQRESISSPEQFISLLNSNGNGADNLAANSDITSGAQRGTNGVSSANLRNQGPGATLILLNGRRVASHGLGGGAVDVNQIPFAAVERVEVLKDGASAIYGTDAIGGVINFIMKKNYQGMTFSGFLDKTEQGGGDIYRASVTSGAGDLNNDGFNIMMAMSYSENKILRGLQRDFVTTNLPSFGLSADTRGTPFATIFPVGTTTQNPTTTLITSGNAPFVPGSTTIRGGAINTLDIPGGAGCSSYPGMFAYDEQLWPGSLASAYACAYETGKPATLQQPLQTLSFFGRAVGRLGDHEISLEYTRSDADARKSFSENQLSNNGTTLQLRYPRNALTAATYDKIVGQLQTAFPGIVLNVGNPIAYRWRCMICGPRSLDTNTQAQRLTLGLEGPIFGGWEYRAGASYASSSSKSRLGTGYFFRGTTDPIAAVPAINGNPAIPAVASTFDSRAPTAPGATQPGIVGVLNAGLLNPFLAPGESQSAAGIAALQAISANGVTLYGGKFSVTDFDGTVSGDLFNLPGGTAKAAIGFDYRVEKYRFNGDERAATGRPVIFNAPFDDAFAVTPRERTIKAAFAELLLPLFTGFEVNAALRADDYSVFGSTVNPKVSFRYQPVSAIAFRGSYSTGFRVPSISDLYRGTILLPLPGADLADPKNCPNGIPISGNALCGPINPDVMNGGNLALTPEKSKQYGLGLVFEPTRNFSATIDWWKINRTGAITTVAISDLAANYAVFEDRFIRDSAGKIILVDQRVTNAGAAYTQGVDVSLRGSFDLAGGSFGLGMDGTYLLEKKSQLVPTAALSASEIGKFTFSGDLGLRWKHNAWINYNIGDFGLALSQIFRLGYSNGNIGRVKSGEITRPDVVYRTKDYITYNFSLSYTGIKGAKMVAGVKNIFNTDPPFAITYDTNTGAGSSWEPRVADPRGRAFTLLLEYKF